MPAYLGSVVTRTHFWGNVSDLAVPGLATATMELVGPDAAIVMDVIRGDPGPPGKDADIVRMQYQDDFTDPSQLPTTLGPTAADINKAWWIGNNVYVWTGSSFRQKAMGTAGPPGPVPNITPSINLIDPDSPTPSSIVVTGDPANPNWLLNLKAPRGPQGSNATISGASDLDLTLPQEVGQAIVWNGIKWQPEDVGWIFPQVFSIPEGAFNSFSGISTLQNVAHIALPPQPFPWMPLVFGHLRAVGLQVSTDPLTLGSAVFLGNDGNAGGQLIGRGFGNISTFANIIPHFSQPGATMAAVAPGNGMAVVPANHTGTQGDLYVDLWNEGALSSYSFNNKDAQLFVIVLPMGKPPSGS
jgi:hypothetical protein